MAGLIRSQWTAYWRRIARMGTAGKSNLVVLAIAALIGFDQYAKLLRKITPAELELLLAAVLVLCVAPMWNSVDLAITPRGLARFPLTLRERFAVQLFSRFVPPFSWILAAFCAGVLWPLHGAPAGFVFLWGATAAGIAIENLRAASTGRRILSAIGWVFLAIGIWAWKVGKLDALVRALPSHLVVDGSPVALAALIGLALLMTLLAVRSLAWTLETAPASETPRRPALAVTSLYRKELRSFAELPEERLVWLVLLLFCFYLATAPSPEPDALRAILAAFSWFTMSASLNCFGRDGAEGLDRFALLPLRGRRIIEAKNLAFVSVVTARCVPALALALWRFGWREASLGAVEAASLALANLAWGNTTSVRHPSSGEPGVILDQVVGFAASAIPGGLAILILRGSPQTAPFAMCGLLAVCAGLHYVSLGWAGRYFEEKLDAMRDWMA